MAGICRMGYVFFGLMLLLNAAFAFDGASTVQQSGITGGLIVHLNISETQAVGPVTGSLYLGERYIVHGTDTDPEVIEKARAYLLAENLYGKVSVDNYDGTHLPYADNVVNLIVGESLASVSKAEVMRVLVPNGIALIGETRITKPRPSSIDEWTHYLHGPDNNAVANDSVVAHPRHMQWLADPLWIRHHGMLASVQAPVSANGRLFYIMDKVWVGFTLNEPQWCVIARDAFNGKELWTKRITSWSDFTRGFRSGPSQLRRTLVADAEYVYAILLLDGPISVLNAETGQDVRVLENSEKTEEFIVCDELVFGIVTTYDKTEQAFMAQASKSPITDAIAQSKVLRAFDRNTGQCLWQWPKEGSTNILPSTLAAANHSIYCAQSDTVVCLNRSNGEMRWKTDTRRLDMEKNRPGPHGVDRRIGWSVGTLVVSDDVVLYSNGQVVTALPDANGEPLWQHSSMPTFLASGVDILVQNKQVWLGETFTQSLDLYTGKVVRDNDLTGALLTAGHHHRCYRNKATSRFIIMSKRGAEFIDMAGDDHSRNNWIRGLCQYGMLPCNALLYLPPHECGCYKEAKLFGFWALAPERSLSRVPESARLVKGPAFGQSVSHNKMEDPWPMYRGDELRSGAKPRGLGSQLNKHWTATVGSNLTVPVVAENRVVVADMSTHQIIALSAETGQKIWTFTTGGRVDSAPTLYEGLVLFGSTDGKVYCLRASDGQNLWTFNAALGYERTLVLEQLESLWPVSGSVLVKDGVCYFVCGRSSYLDGGLRLYGLDPFTGNVLYSSVMDSKQAGVIEKPALPKGFKGDYKTVYAPDKSDAFFIEGNIADILVSDGNSIYLRHIKYDATLKRQEGFGAHLYSTSTLLDRSEAERSHWMIGGGDYRQLPKSSYQWMTKPRHEGFGQFVVPFGKMLSFDQQRAWGVKHLEKAGGLRDALNLYCQDLGSLKLGDPGRDYAAQPMPTPIWDCDLDIHPMAIVKAGSELYVAGVALKDYSGKNNDLAGKPGLLRIYSADTGSVLANHPLKSAPIFDGIAIARRQLYISTSNGEIVCLTTL